ncbi:MAG: hypothetical protein A3G75_08835 [Verrucomicrobia bacterium RIFCSPLOWO2_12_FULL_64_8]|nr:MAG: hypothetical protein A3G75_08835 [Verrucomicrobia bacterium RIFCSPLOWO2_12_FULL_64_8]
MHEFFDTTLPGTLDKYKLVLSFSPRFSDLARRKYLRLPVELRYGWKQNCEFYGGITPFTINPFQEGPDRRWGPGLVKLGARYDFVPLIYFYEQMTVGFEAFVPLQRIAVLVFVP